MLCVGILHVLCEIAVQRERAKGENAAIIMGTLISSTFFKLNCRSKTYIFCNCNLFDSIEFFFKGRSVLSEYKCNNVD